MCTKPLKGFKYGKTKNGRDNYIIVSPLVDHLEIDKYDNCISAPTRLISNPNAKIIRECVEIPCGQCMECRLEYSRQWANRCLISISNILF